MSTFDDLEDSVRAMPVTRMMPKALRGAIGVLAQCDPFFSAFLSGLTLEQSADVPVMATNCVDTILYNADAIEADAKLWTPALLACVLAHEMMHILRDDGPFMLSAKRPDLANVAADACINRDLLKTGWKWPGAQFVDPLRPHGVAGAGGIALYASTRPLDTTRGIYNTLSQHNAKDEQHPSARGDVAGKEYKKAAKGHGGKEKARDYVRELANEAARQADEATYQDAPKPDPQGEGERDQGNGQGEDGGNGWSLESSAAWRELESLGVRVRSPLTTALRRAGSAVRGLMRSKSQRHSSLLAPSPLSADMGRLMAGRRRAVTIKPGIAIDASGSISNDQMQVQVAAANQWAQQYVGRARALPACFFCERIVADGSMRDFKPGFKVPGAGGGTDFNPVIAWGLAHKVTHLVIFTDACGPWPVIQPRGMRLILVLPGAFLNHQVPLTCDRVELDVPYSR